MLQKELRVEFKARAAAQLELATHAQEVADAAADAAEENGVDEEPEDMGDALWLPEFDAAQ